MQYNTLLISLNINCIILFRKFGFCVIFVNLYILIIIKLTYVNYLEWLIIVIVSDFRIIWPKISFKEYFNNFTHTLFVSVW